MSLLLKIDAEEQKNSFIVFDCTGIYRFDNLCGWNAPNPEIRKLTKSVLSVWPPQLKKDAVPYTIDLLGKFPNIEFNGIEILPYQVGQANNQLESGNYKIRLDITGLDKKGVEYSTFAVITRVFINNVICCIDKQQKNVNKDAFKDQKQQAIIEMNELLEATIKSIKCELYEQATEMVNLLKSQCACNGC